MVFQKFLNSGFSRIQVHSLFYDCYTIVAWKVHKKKTFVIGAFLVKRNVTTLYILETAAVNLVFNLKIKKFLLVLRC